MNKVKLETLDAYYREKEAIEQQIENGSSINIEALRKRLELVEERIEQFLQRGEER